MKPAGQDGVYTVRQLWQFYVRFNEVYFRNVLPMPSDMDYVDAMPQGCCGAVACVVCEGSTLRKVGGNYRILLLHPFFKGKDPRLILCSLLHEMVHIHLHRVAPAHGENHGPLFKAACKRLQRLGWNVDSVLNPTIRAFEPCGRQVGVGFLSRSLGRPVVLVAELMRAILNAVRRSM